jgi:hypothetical protein
MKRRRFFQAALAIPAGSALLAQQPVTPATASAPPLPQQPGPGPNRGSGMEYPKIETAAVDQAGSPVLHFFTASQFATLKRLSDLLMPSGGAATGALEARVPEFLDFHVGKSPAERKKIYTAGLDALNDLSTLKQKKPFADLDDAAAGELLAPAIKPWSYVPPADPLAHFLEEARHDIRTATVNSREYASAGLSENGGRGGGRRQGGVGLYWHSLD